MQACAWAALAIARSAGQLPLCLCPNPSAAPAHIPRYQVICPVATCTALLCSWLCPNAASHRKNPGVAHELRGTAGWTKSLGQNHENRDAEAAGVGVSPSQREGAGPSPLQNGAFLVVLQIKVKVKV